MTTTKEENNDFVEPFDDATAKKDEDFQIEMKSSIVFDQATSRPDLDNQLGFNIMKEIAALANAKGGYLYIGITNSGGVVGIEGDYTHLNEGTMLPRGYRYHPSWDDFRRIIMDVAKRRLQPDIDRLIRITKMPTSSGKTVCRVYVKPCRDNQPVYYHFLGKQRLFVRNSASEAVERTGAEWDREIANWQDHLANDLPPPETDSEDGLYFSILDDGTITLRERKRNGLGIRRRIPVPAKTNIKGWLLFVYDDGTLQFENPNRIMREIKQTGGFSQTRIPNPSKIIGAFFYQGKSYVFVSTVWQEALDGFKCFDPEELFESGIEPSSPKRFLVDGAVESRDCYLIPNGEELDKFWETHPYWESNPFDYRITMTAGTFHPANKESYGSLVQDVDYRLFTDLVHLARTGRMPATSSKPSLESFYLRAFCKDQMQIGFKVERTKPPIHCMTAADNPSAKFFCCQHHRERSPHPPFIEIERRSRADYNINDCMVLLFYPGVPVLSGIFPIFPGFENEGGILDIPTQAILHSFFFTNLNDYLVIVNKTDDSDPRDAASCQFFLIPVKEIPQCFKVPDPDQQKANLSRLKAFNEWGLRNGRVIAAGILQSKPGKTDLPNLPAWLSSSEWFRTPQCPIKWFAPNVWIRVRGCIRNAKICSFDNGAVVESPIRFDKAQLSQIQMTTDQFGNLTDGIVCTVPKSVVECHSKDDLAAWKRRAQTMGASFQIQEDDEFFQSKGFQPFMIEKNEGILSASPSEDPTA